MALIECPECGKQVSDKASACPNCGCPIKQDKPKDEKEYLCCPKCHSKELHAEHQGFSGGKAFAGAVLTGGIGILAGTIGSKDVRITCLKCGNHFKAGEAIIEKGYTENNNIEARIVEFLKRDEVANALTFYRNETHKDFKTSMDYIHEVAWKNGIEIKQDKGSNDGTKVVLALVCVALVGCLLYWILRNYFGLFL